MSIAFACATGRAAGVVSLAGAMDIDSTCVTTKPFTFLQIHGVADKTIKIDGGLMNGFQYTSAAETINRIATINKCSKKSFVQAAIYKKDFDPTITGSETTVQTLEKCTKPIMYWRIARGSHSPKLPANYAEQILNYLASTIN
jgi:polyhydroxybutyrate depolymerase